MILDRKSKHHHNNIFILQINELYSFFLKEIIVKEDSVKLMNKPPTVEVLVCPKNNKSLAYTNIY